MAKNSTHVRVSKALHQRLTLMAESLLQAHIEGRLALPSDQVERVTPTYVITRALDELDGHRARAKQQAARKTRAGQSVALAKDVLTPQAQELPG